MTQSSGFHIIDWIMTLIIAPMYFGFGVYILAKPVAYGKLTGIEIVAPIGNSEWRVAGACYLMLGLVAAVSLFQRELGVAYIFMLFFMMAGLMIVRLISLFTGNMQGNEYVYAAFELAFFIYAVYALWSRGWGLKRIFDLTL